MNRVFLGPDKPLRTTLLSTFLQRARAAGPGLLQKMMSAVGGLRALRAPLLDVVSAVGCGASIQAVYEANVRFEHCMALDARPDVKPTIRQECWSEWLTFYTYGQTRDRVRHARMRIRYLSGQPELPAGANSGSGGGLGSNEVVSGSGGGSVTIGNTTARGFGGRGPPTSAPGGAGPQGAAGDSAGAEQTQRCLALCQGLRKVCRQQCATAGCEKLCGANYRQCSRACR